MTNSRASGGLLKVANYKASGTDADETFTFIPIFDPEKYSRIIIQMEGTATAALDILMQINSLTTNTYFEEGLSMTAGTVAGVNRNAQAQQIIHTAGGANAFSIELQIGVHETTDTSIFGNAQSHNLEGEIAYRRSFYNSTATATITTIKIYTSTSTWIAGTRITIWFQRR